MSDMRIGGQPSQPVGKAGQAGPDTASLKELAKKVEGTATIPTQETAQSDHVGNVNPKLQAELKDKIERSFKEKYFKTDYRSKL